MCTSVSRAGGRSNRTRLGVRGVRGSASGELSRPGFTTMSSSSEELPDRRPRSSSCAGSAVLSPSLRVVFVLALAMLLSRKHYCGGVIMIRVKLIWSSGILEDPCLMARLSAG